MLCEAQACNLSFTVTLFRRDNLVTSVCIYCPYNPGPIVNLPGRCNPEMENWSAFTNCVMLVPIPHNSLLNLFLIHSAIMEHKYICTYCERLVPINQHSFWWSKARFPTMTQHSWCVYCGDSHCNATLIVNVLFKIHNSKPIFMVYVLFKSSYDEPAALVHVLS